MADDESNLARFGWAPGQLCYIDENGNTIRIGPITPEDRTMIEKLQAAGYKLKPEYAQLLAEEEPTGDWQRE